jgi:hypothetical protein
MDEYYQNSPLPTWIGWYVAHLPHWFHAATAAGTLVLELVLALMLFFPRRVRLVCFFIVTPWEVGVILTGNYTFLNYLVLSLGFLLLDDRFLSRLVPARFMPSDPEDCTVSTTNESSRKHSEPTVSEPLQLWNLLRILRIAVAAFMLTWIAYNTTAKLIGIVVSRNPLPAAPVDALEPFRIANQYGLFAVMTNGRYEIEFQGSEDGQNWTPYPFRYKPQALNEPPGIYAPYQPRFDWNLWFASLGDWRQNDIVPYTEERLIKNDADVLALFRDNPFKTTPPRYVRAILWQYWFTSMDEKHRTGNWWRRRMLGLYAPEITTVQGGSFNVVEWPDELPAHD